MLRHLGHDAASRLRHLYDRHLQSQYSDRKIYWENRSFSRSQYKTIAVVGRNPGTPGEIRCTSCPFTATPTSSCPLDPLPCDPILDPEVPMEKRLAGPEKVVRGRHEPGVVVGCRRRILPSIISASPAASHPCLGLSAPRLGHIQAGPVL